jgi:hypothetical protein
LLEKDVSCLERVETESDRKIDEHVLRPRRRCVAATSTPAISTVTSAKRRLTYCTAIVKPDSSTVSKFCERKSRTVSRVPVSPARSS